MIAAAHQADGRAAERDALLIMMAYRHGLRASAPAGLRWDQIDLGLAHFTSHAGKMARPQLIHFEVPSCAHCDPGSATRTRRRPTCSPHFAAGR
jgi:integrase